MILFGAGGVPKNLVGLNGRFEQDTTKRHFNLFVVGLQKVARLGFALTGPNGGELIS